jgi:hypothetical protein
MPSGSAALVRHGREVAKLEGAQAQEFLRLLRDLKDNLLGRLTAQSDNRPFDAFRLRTVLAEAQAGIDALERKAGAFYGKAEHEAAELAADHLEDEIRRLGLAFDREPLIVSIDPAAALADPAQGLLAQHFETSVERYGGDVLNQVRQRVFVGLRSGDSFADVSRSVGVAIEGTAGNAKRLVRTEISQAYGSAQHSGIAQAAKQVKGLVKVWMHIGSFVCPVCMPLHGTERPLDGTWTIKQGKKTKQVAHAPAHPQCVCRVAAMKPGWREKMKALGYLDQRGPDAHPSL